MRESGFDNARGNAVGAADQLDDDVDLGIGGHCRGIFIPAHRRQLDTAVAAPVSGRYRRHDKASAAALGQHFGLVLKQFQRAGTHGAEPGNGDL